ncbi:MAG: DUF1194 domain-containing protein [Dinoroseobacter sp.]|nr:DUF1194 domain-containing protein [Dinoroseobacter sp.]
MIQALAVMFALLPALAIAQDVEVELVLMADASGSIDAAEIEFQRQGYATALQDREVLRAIANSAYGRIAVTYVEWAAAGAEDIVVPWRIVDGPESAAAFAAEFAGKPRRAFGRNSIGSALMFGTQLIETNDYDGWRKVIDFSGDSANNWNGPSIAEGRAAALEAGITINGLPILCRFCSRPGAGDLEQLYADRIIGGRGAFVITADGMESLADAIRRKLILEIGGTMPAKDYASIRATNLK